MSTYSGRRAPNVSEYINSLNTISTAQDLGNSDEDFLDFSNTDLDMFTNAEFFDLGMEMNSQPVVAAPTSRQSTSYATSPSDAFTNTNLQFNDFSNFTSNLDIKPAQPQANAAIVSQASPIAASPISRTHQLPKVGDKRKLDFLGDPASAHVLEEESRLAAEEDKRRRNTAASARFRVKKKQREQALERSAKEMTEKVALLEAENQRLKMENKWLKGIIVEKDGKSKGSEVADELNRRSKAETEDNETREVAHTKGVGTN